MYFSQLTRSEVQDVVIAALEQVNVSELHISVAEGFQFPLDELERASSGISDNVESVNIYLEDNKCNSEADENGTVIKNGEMREGQEMDDDLMISATQQSRKVCKNPRFDLIYVS